MAVTNCSYACVVKTYSSREWIEGTATTTCGDRGVDLGLIFCIVVSNMYGVVVVSAIDLAGHFRKMLRLVVGIPQVGLPLRGTELLFPEALRSE